MKRWRLAEPITEEFKDQFPEIDPIVLQLLFNRGVVTQEQIDEFLNPDYTKDVHDPFLFNDMDKAVNIIFKAIKKGRKIVVHGDYDADGVSASVILISTIKALGGENIDVYLPHREKEGYGLNSETVKYLAERGTDLLITCDCGISNHAEIELARENKMEVIITDHHVVPSKLPPALAILHPLLPEEKYPYKYLTGGGVAFKLAQGLIARDKKNKKILQEGFDKWLLDMVAVSTVADFGPLWGENRTLVKYGLIVLGKTKRLGLRELYKQAGIDLENIDTTTIGWKIAPRINAAGRLDHANAAYKLLMSDDREEAERLSKSLNNTNSERQAVTEKIIKEAMELIGEPEDKVVVVVGKNWPLGIVGLVAGRLSNRFNRPAFVLGDNGKEIVGSARSNIDFNLADCLKKINKFLSKHGGHSGAAGFRLKNRDCLDDFIAALKDLANKNISDEQLIPLINIDSQIVLDEVDWDFYEELEKFEPGGRGNHQPLFLAQGVSIVEFDTVGKEAHHLRLRVKHQGQRIFKVIGFCFANPEKVGADWCRVLKAGDKLDLLLEIGVNEWNGKRELQFKIVDLKISEEK